jgi:aspartyl-tRNA(Asn)/glutamyl-tRNA(Gln) amidotransferase subunit C
MPNITSGTVMHIASLIRLNIHETEAEIFSNQFSQIIEYFQILNTIDTDDVKPACLDWPVYNVFRDDKVSPSLLRNEFLINVNDHDERYVIAPKIMDLKKINS